MNIVEMLRSRTVDAARLAAELERKYCSSRHDSPPPLPTQLTIPHLPPSDALQIEMTSQHPVQPAVAVGMYKGYLLLFAHPMLCLCILVSYGKAEAEAQPSSFAAKFTHYLSSNPVIRAAMYTPVTAKMAAEVFTWSQHTESPPPTTMTELFTAFTLKTLVDHLSTHPVYHKQQLKVTTFSDLPTDVYKQFQDLCRMAYEGILNRQQLVFSVIHLPTGFAPLGLMQEVPQLYTEGRAFSYHFIHLTLQEYLAALHISQLPVPDQTELVQEHLDSGHFKRTIRFVSGLTKLANIPPDITKKLMESDDTKLICFHFLFEAKDISMTTRTLGSDEMSVESHYSWTPLDYYVTGHAISHSSCSWNLCFQNSSIDNEKFELFSQGCATPGGTGCRATSHMPTSVAVTSLPEA